MNVTNEKKQNGNGKGEYQPEVEFHYLKDVNLWIEKDEYGNEKITYTDEVAKELEEDGESDSNSNN